MSDANTLQAEYPVKVTNLEKVLWPEAGVTKAEYIQYMIAMSPYMLPHYQDRMLTVIRYPHGIHDKFFYQKNVPDGAPEWVKTFGVWSIDSERDIYFIVANNTATLIWLANQAAMELHPSYTRIDRLDMPTQIAFDLDPTIEGGLTLEEGFETACEVALHLKKILDDLGLPSYPKTSGATGLQIFVPIANGYKFEETRPLTHFIGMYMAENFPQIVTIERLKKDRGKKVYFDYLQHAQGKTLSGPYTPRAVKSAAVSAPVTWQELEKGITPDMFTVRTMPVRIQEKGDLFAPLTKPGVEIREILHVIKHHPTR